jgi:BlaI family penicillinase repressor
MKRRPVKLGRVQLQIMQVLWDNGDMTARQITDRLSLTQTIAHSTVQTLLRQMEEKGLIGHRVEERVFLFFPISHRTEIAGTLAQDLLKQVFQGSLYGLVSSLLTEEAISADELGRIRTLIDAHTEARQSGEKDG